MDPARPSRGVSGEAGPGRREGALRPGGAQVRPFGREVSGSVPVRARQVHPQLRVPSGLQGHARDRPGEGVRGRQQAPVRKDEGREELPRILLLRLHHHRDGRVPLADPQQDRAGAAGGPGRRGFPRQRLRPGPLLLGVGGRPGRLLRPSGVHPGQPRPLEGHGRGEGDPPATALCATIMSNLRVNPDV